MVKASLVCLDCQRGQGGRLKSVLSQFDSGSGHFCKAELICVGLTIKNVPNSSLKKRE